MRLRNGVTASRPAAASSTAMPPAAAKEAWSATAAAKASAAGKMASSGELGNILNSWLGDGANAAISAGSIQALLGNQQISDFASTIGTDSTSAAAGLADVIPQIMDKSSSGGNLLASAGGIGGLMDAAKSFLK